MAFYHLPDSNQIINSDHIIRAEFFPEYNFPAHVDGDTGEHVPEKHHKTRLHLVLDELGLEQDIAYDGDIRGSTCASQGLNFHGQEAKLFWNLLVYHSIEVGEPNLDEVPN